MAKKGGHLPNCAVEEVMDKEETEEEKRQKILKKLSPEERRILGIGE